MGKKWTDMTGTEKADYLFKQAQYSNPSASRERHEALAPMLDSDPKTSYRDDPGYNAAFDYLVEQADKNLAASRPAGTTQFRLLDNNGIAPVQGGPVSVSGWQIAPDKIRAAQGGLSPSATVGVAERNRANVALPTGENVQKLLADQPVYEKKAKDDAAAAPETAELNELKNKFGIFGEWNNAPSPADPVRYAEYLADLTRYSKLRENAIAGAGGGNQFLPLDPSESYLESLFKGADIQIGSALESGGDYLLSMGAQQAKNSVNLLRNFDAYDDPVKQFDQKLDELVVPTVQNGYFDKKQQEYADSHYSTGAYALGEEIAQGIGGMVPSIAISAATGNPNLGLSMLFGSAAGQGTSEALAAGATMDEAVMSGTLSGAVEVLTEKMFAGVPLLNKVGWLDDVVKKASKWMVENPAEKAIIDKLVDVLGEGAEEYVSEIAGAYIKRIYDENARKEGIGETFVNTQADAFHSFMVGALTSAVMNAGNRIASGKPVSEETGVDSQQSSADAQVIPQVQAQPPTTRQDAAMQAQETNVPTENQTAQTGVQVGRATTIKNPYTGETPTARGTQTNTPVVSQEQYATAQRVLKNAQEAARSPGHSFKGVVRKFYEGVFDKMGGQRSVSVEDATFGGKSYVVSLNKNLVGKVVSDPHISAEKMAVINMLDDVVENAAYVGSGKYGKGNPNVIRYDYFETPVLIDEKPYVTSFDVEVLPLTNNYRTHKVINEINLTSSESADTGPEPAAISEKSGLQSPISADNGKASLLVAPSAQDFSATSIPESNTDVNNQGMQRGGDLSAAQDVVSSQNQSVASGTGDVAKVLPADADHNTANSALGVIDHTAINAVDKIKQGFQAFYKNIVSGQAGLESAAKSQSKADGDSLINETTQLARQTSGTVNAICTTALVTPDGAGALDVSYNEIMKLVPVEQWEEFNDYRENLHNIDRQAQEKAVNANTAEQSRKIVSDYEARHPEWREVVERQNQWWDRFAQEWLVKSGLITQESYDAMRRMYPNYIPTYREDGKTGGGIMFGGKIKADPIKSAKGSTKAVIPLQEQFIAQVNKIVRQERINEIGKELLSFARNSPQEAARSGIALSEAVKEGFADDVTASTLLLDSTEKAALRQLDDGTYRFTVMENGEPVALTISKDIYDSVDFLRGSGLYDGFNTFHKVTSAMTAPVKAGITGYNPLFVLSNFVRDIQSYAVNSTKGGGAKWVSNYFRAMSEIAKNGELYNQLKALGGMNSGYYNTRDGYRATLPKSYTGAEKVIRTATAPLRSAKNAIEFASEFIESVPRMAEYMNVIDKVGNTAEGRKRAALASQDVTVNFTRSAPITKGLNGFVLYLNASVQGIDKTVRQIKANPGQTLLSAGLSVALPSILLAIINAGNPNHDDLDDRTKDQYFCIPNLFGERDENGYAKTFFKFPRSREYGIVLGAVFDRVMQGVEHGEWDEVFEGIPQEVWNNFAPPDVMQDNLVSMFTRVDLFDKDSPGETWYGGDIVPYRLQELSPENQYDVNTSGVAKATGQALGLSPKKVDNLIDSYGGYLGDLLQAATSPKNKGSDGLETFGNTLDAMFVQPAERRFTADPRYSSSPVDEFYDLRDEATRAANDRNMEENIPSPVKTPEEVGRSYLDGISSQISKLYAQERELWAQPEKAIAKQQQSYEIREQINDLTRDAENVFDQIIAEERAKWDDIYNFIDEQAYNNFIEKSDKNANGTLTQVEVKECIDQDPDLSRLDRKYKAILWRVATGATSDEKNPYGSSGM